MTSRRLRIASSIVLVWLLGAAWAQEALLPPEAQKVLEQYDRELAKLRDKVLIDLQRVQDRETKAGHLEGALAIKEARENLATTPATSPPLDVRNLTHEQYLRAKGKEVVVKASEILDTGMILDKDQKMMIVPDPDDQWAGSPSPGSCNYRGADNILEGHPFMALMARVGDEIAKKPVMDDPIVVGPGKIFLYANDTGPADDLGKIKVKLVPVR